MASASAPELLGYDPWLLRPIALRRRERARIASGEFKEMVRALHEEGIEVILDLVSTTREGNECGPVLSFKGLDNHLYYMTDHGPVLQKLQRLRQYLNCNHPTVKELIIDCLRHW